MQRPESHVVLCRYHVQNRYFCFAFCTATPSCVIAKCGLSARSRRILVRAQIEWRGEGGRPHGGHTSFSAFPRPLRPSRPSAFVITLDACPSESRSTVIRSKCEYLIVAIALARYTLFRWPLLYSNATRSIQRHINSGQRD